MLVLHRRHSSITLARLPARTSPPGAAHARAEQAEIVRDSFDGRDCRQGIEPAVVSLEPTKRIADCLGMLRRKALRRDRLPE